MLGRNTVALRTLLVASDGQGEGDASPLFSTTVSPVLSFLQATVLSSRQPPSMGELSGRWLSVQLAIYGFGGVGAGVGGSFSTSEPLEEQGLRRCGLAGAGAWSMLALALQIVGSALFAIIMVVKAFTPPCQSEEGNRSESAGTNAPTHKLQTMAYLGFAATFVLCALDRWLVLRLALTHERRLGALHSHGGGGSGKVMARIGSSHALCLALWLPLLMVSLALASFDDDGSHWTVKLDLSRTECQIDKKFVNLIFANRRLPPLLFDVLPVASFGSAMLMLWSECTAIGRLATKIVEGILATPEAERDVELTLRSFGKVQAALAQASERWSAVLLVQLLLFLTLTGATAATIITHRPRLPPSSRTAAIVTDEASSSNGTNTDTDTAPTLAMVALVLPVMWPLVLSFATVVRVNAIFDEIPARVTAEFLFTSIERCAFAEDYTRLGLRLRVLGVQLTTQRMTGVLTSSVMTIMVTYVVSLYSHTIGYLPELLQGNVEGGEDSHHKMLSA